MRLAYEQGLLSGHRLNWGQWWASMYHMSYKRWFSREVRDDFLKRFTLVTNPKRYMEVYAPPLAPPAMEEFEEAPISPDEFDSIEKFLEDVDKKRKMSAAQLDDDEGWQ